MVQKYIDKFSDSELRDISHLGGLEITSEMALSELKVRRNQKTDKITFYENKIFIKKTEDKIAIYNIGSYNDKNGTLSYDRLTIVTESDIDLHEACVQYLVDMSATMRELEWKLDGFVETNPEIFGDYVNKYHIIFNNIKTILNG